MLSQIIILECHNELGYTDKLAKEVKKEEMKAVILAGGFGTRLRPLTFTKPKPMVPLVNRPVIEHVVDYLVSHGLDDIVVTTTFLREMIMDHFIYRDDVRLSYPTEPKPLGTAGSVKNAGLEIEEEEPFVVIQGDNITDMDLRGLIDFHYEAGGLVTIALTHVEDPWHYGVAKLEGDGCISRFHEKPDKGKCFSNLASTGIYVVDPKALEFVPDGIAFDFAKDLFHLLQAKAKGKMFGYEMDTDNFWADVGQSDGYMKAMGWMLKKAGRDAFIGENVEFNGSGITGPTVIGDSVVIEEGCSIGPSAVLFEDVYIGKNSSLEQCFIGERTMTGENACVKRAIIGAQCELGNEVAVLNGKIWPFVTIPHRSTVDNTLKRFVRFDGNGDGGREENENLLRTVSDEEAFYFNMRKGGEIVHTGFIAHSLEMFVDILKKVDQRSIKYHLGECYNDFAEWIRDVFRGEKLASEVASMQWWESKSKLISLIQEHINELKSGVVAKVDAS
jgi:NDP-sugar pyrophosphorylase family protein